MFQFGSGEGDRELPPLSFFGGIEYNDGMMSKLENLIKEYREQGIQDQIDYDKLYLYSIITHSTAVEGSTVTEIENQLLFDEGISPNKPIEEQLMNLDLKNAYEKGFEYAGEQQEYSVEMLCTLSALVMKNTGSEYKTISGDFSSANGELRRINVTAGRGGKSYMAWQKVSSKLEEFCEWINSERKSLTKSDATKIYQLSFMAHYNLATIHPWADGNGRMSRLVMNMIQYEFGVIPVIVRKECRIDYIKSLSESQGAGNAEEFLDFMFEHHGNNLAERIENHRTSLQDDTLNLKNDTLNDTIKLSAKESTVYEAIKADCNISINDIVEKTGFSRPTVTRAIARLKELGIISRSGSKKTGHWIIQK